MLKKSPQQWSFRRDLTIIREAATIVDAKVVQRFIAYLLERKEVHVWLRQECSTLSIPYTYLH